MPIENIVYVGAGSKFPSILMFDNLLNGNTPVIVSEFQNGCSVYSLEISPRGTSIIAGTKSGLLRVFSLTDYRVSKGAKPLFEMYHPPAVLTLAFSTDDIFVSGGIDGKIKFWSVSQQKMLGEVFAHHKGVLALCRLCSLLMASIGGDGVLRVWHLDSLDIEFESEVFDLPKIQALTSLVVNTSDEILIHPSRSGGLHIYDIKKNLKEKVIVKAHDGDFCAVACGNLCGHENIVTGGYDDKILKVWSARADKLICESLLHDSIISIGWYGRDQIMVLTADGTGQIWNFNGDLTPGPKFENYDLRTTASLSSFLVTKSFLKRRRELLNTLIFEADSLLKAYNANEYPESVNKRLREIRKELDDNAFKMESTLLYADILRRQHKCSEELRVRLDIAKSIKGTLQSVPNLYALGDLLERWNEPELAIKCFEEIMDINPDYRNTQERVDTLNSKLSGKIEFSRLLRCDLLKKEQFIAELEKCTVLEKRFESKVILEMLKPINIGRKIDLQNIADSFMEIIKSRGINPDKMFVKNMDFFAGNNQISNYDIVCLDSLGIKEISYGFRIESTGWNSKLIPFVIFDASSLNFDNEVSPKEYNQKIIEIWNEHLTSSETKKWIEQTNAFTVKAIRKAIAEMTVEF